MRVKDLFETAKFPVLVDGRDIFLRPGEQLVRVVVRYPWKDDVDHLYVSSLTQPIVRGSGKYVKTFPAPTSPGDRFYTTFPVDYLEPYPEDAKLWRSVIGVGESLHEARKPIMDILRRELPGWPDYVIKDMLYIKISTPGDLESKLAHVRSLAKEVKSWKLHRGMFLTFDMLDSETQHRMKVKREFGRKVPTDWPLSQEKERNVNAERIVKAKDMGNLPPIIMVKNSGGLDLWEGWHRTMAAFRLFPRGFKVNAWIGYP